MKKRLFSGVFSWGVYFDFLRLYSNTLPAQFFYPREISPNEKA